MSAHAKPAVARIVHIGLVVLLLSLSTSAVATPLEAYGNLPKYDELQLSPSGTRLALVQTAGSQRAIAIISLADGKLISSVGVGDEKLRGIEWTDDDHVLISRSVTTNIPGFVGRHELMNLISLEVGTRKMTSLPVGMRGVDMLNTVFTEPMARSIDGHTVLFFTCLTLVRAQGKTVPVLVRYDIQSGAQRIISYGTESSQGWFVDDAGRVVAQVDYDQKKQEWKLIAGLDEARSRVVQTGSSPFEIPSVAGFARDAGTLLIRTLEGDAVVYRTLTLDTGALSEGGVLPGESGPLFDSYSHRMTGYTFVADSVEYHFADAVRQSAWQSTTKVFEGDRVQLASASADFTKLVVRVDGRKNGFAYQLVDLGAGRATRIGDVYADIKVLNETRAVTYKAADGLPIRAYLTLPDGHPPSKLPLVVLAHGGPASRDTADFDWWAQAFASQGYAVLQANYRGSSLGYKFIASGFGEWGRKMQTDLSDGVKYLVDEGTVDPARVCIAGGSYGGYAALAGVALQSHVYRCAISVAGLGDLQLMLRFENNYKSDATQRYWDRFMGVTGPSDPVVAKISPYEHVDAITAPILLIHGKDDTVVPYQQSDTMAAALKRASRSVELVTLKREDHWLSRPETRVQMLQSSVGFLRKYNPPD